MSSLLLWLFRSSSTITFPCPPLHSCGPQESCTEKSACPQVDWRGWGDCEGWEMDTASGVADILSVVYAVSVTSSFASDWRDRPVAATTPTPCRNGSWKYEEEAGQRGNSHQSQVTSFNIKRSNNKIRGTYTDWATVWGRMSLMPRCRPSFKLSEITNTGRLGAGSTSRSSSSSSSSSVILWYINVTVFTLQNRGYSMCWRHIFMW